MDGFKAALEVNCICHVPLKTDLKKMDFGTNVKDYKIIAREMMLMTSKIN